MSLSLNKLLRWYTPFLIFVATVVLIFEAYHHSRNDHLFFLESEFWFEFLLYGVFVPVIGLRILRMAQKSEGKLNKAELTIHHHYKLNQLLTKATTWDDLINAVVEYPSSVLPVTQTYLHIYDAKLQVFSFAGVWNAAGQSGGLSLPPIIHIQDCQAAQTDAFAIVKDDCNLLQDQDSFSDLSRFGMTFFYQGERVALMHIDLPATTILENDNVGDFAGQAPKIAMALVNAMLKRDDSQQQQALETYRRHIAQDIHDTLGQNIAYLRLKLDKLVEYGNLQDIKDVYRELEQMRVVADVAYANMRETLNILKPAGPQQTNTDISKELPAALLEQAQLIGVRSHLKVNLTMDGKPRNISSATQQQILLIAGEAIHNIEKHAGAENITLHLSWEETQLKLEIIDDGCGFCTTTGPAEALSNGHYGLTIMQRRAHEINGQLAISSQAGMGTSISLQLPLVTQG